MKANAEPRLLSSLVWIDSGVVVSQHRLESFFHEIKCNGMTSFMEFMVRDPFLWFSRHFGPATILWDDTLREGSTLPLSSVPNDEWAEFSQGKQKTVQSTRHDDDIKACWDNCFAICHENNICICEFYKTEGEGATQAHKESKIMNSINARYFV